MKHAGDSDLPIIAYNVAHHQMRVNYVARAARDTALLPGNLNGRVQFVPDLTIKRIPDGGHWVIHEHPALVKSYIRQFLASTSGVRRIWNGVATKGVFDADNRD